MLLGNGTAGVKQVAVVTRSAQFMRLMTGLLTGWKYSVTEPSADSRLIIAERGLPLPATQARVVWLTPLPLDAGDFLLVPLSPTQLYLALEEHFFPNPRRHIRINLNIDIDLQFSEQWLEGRLVSLSGRGARISCAMEIPTGTPLQIEMKLAGRTLRLPAEALYCIPEGDSVGRTQPQVGVRFKPEEGQIFGMLQRFIEKSCIEAACVRVGIAFSDHCVSWFDLATDPWEKTD